MLGFWIFMLMMALLIPATMIGFGRLFVNKTPDRINAAFGYRTARSMKNQDTWRFAHQYCGRLWVKLGWMIVPLAVIPLLFVFGKEIGTIGYTGLAVVFLQAALLVGTIIPTESALKKTFDKNGQRKEE